MDVKKKDRKKGLRIRKLGKIPFKLERTPFTVWAGYQEKDWKRKQKCCI